VLDYAVDTGKPAGKDLHERKVTLPLLHAMKRIPSLKERLEPTPPTWPEVNKLREEVQACGALEASLDQARHFVQQGLIALRDLPDSEGREALEILAHYVVDRVR